MKGTLPLMALALTLCSGCETAATRGGGAAAYRIPAGSELVLAEAITIPAGEAHVKLQHGKVVPAVDEYTINCEFRMRDLGPQEIAPGSFPISNVSDSREWFSYPYVMRFYKVIRVDWDRPGTPPKLTCQYWDDPLWGRTISVQQIREALGTRLRLKFPGEQ